MRIKVSIEDQFRDAMHAIARHVGVDLEQVIRNEAAAVFELAAKKTRIAKAGDIRKSIPLKRHVRMPGSDKWWPTDLIEKKALRREQVRQMREAIRKKVDKVLRARGLARKSWIALAKMARIKPPSDATAEAAVARSGKEYPENYSWNEKKARNAYAIALYNNMRGITSKGADGEYAAERAMDGRRKFIVRAVGKQTDKNIAAALKRYPGINPI